ncbi:hypothetical protein PMAYCL1PPCAC_10787, partial [Pristionchus mayeri]
EHWAALKKEDKAMREGKQEGEEFTDEELALIFEKFFVEKTRWARLQYSFSTPAVPQSYNTSTSSRSTSRRSS